MDGYSASSATAAQTGTRLRVAVVVDPYSSGKYLLHELKSQQWPIVGIQSTQTLADFWLRQFDEAQFVKSIRHESLDTTIQALSEFDVVTVLAGSEPGVLLTEDLIDRLKLVGNSSKTKEWRRDKYAMQERLREVGVRAVRQVYSNDIDEILQWQEQWGQWPIIVKPTMSGGTDGVYWCHNADDVRAAHQAECGKMNVNGVVNEKLLAQEYLDGPEYIVDCVSSEGKHVLSGIWIYKKTKDPETRSISYEYARILESTGEEQDKLTAYVFKVLDALELRHGPSHTEIIMCKDGPCLVETGARMHGVKGPKLTEYATGIGTHELVIDVAVNGARLFNDLFNKSTKYSLKKYVFETFLRNGTLEKKGIEGVLAKPIDVQELWDLPSVTDIFPSLKPGDVLKVTRDLATSPGVMLQVHADLNVCFKDIEALRKLESTTLYQVAAENPATPLQSPAFSKQVSPMTQSPLHAPGRGRLFSGESQGPVEFSLDGDLGDEDDLQPTRRVFSNKSEKSAQ